MSELSAEDRILLKSVLAKRAQSIQLTTEEENFARKLFDSMMSSKKTVQKTVEILTGEQLRKRQSNDIKKSQVDAAPIVDDSHPVVGKELPVENANAQPVASAEKIPDADNKPKEITTEEQRLSDATQHSIKKPTVASGSVRRTVEPAPTAKFESADPAIVGDVVIKNFARQGEQIFKGVVLSVDSQGHAMVKWANGLHTTEWAYQLVKCKTESPKANPSVTKAANTEDVQKDGDIATSHSAPSIPEAVQAYPMGGSTTPFESLVNTLNRTVDFASYLKTCQEQHKADPEMYDYYDKLISHLRDIAETVLAGLSMELDEAKQDNPE